MANKKEGDAFLAANKGKDGIVALPSGLQYKILTPGTGPKPTASDTVVCNYRGTLINGTEFDSSYKRGQPATFPVSGVIKGWTEALQLMPVGSKWQLFIPVGTCLWRAGSRTRDRARLNPNFRSRTALDPGQDHRRKEVVNQKPHFSPKTRQMGHLPSHPLLIQLEMSDGNQGGF